MLPIDKVKEIVDDLEACIANCYICENHQNAIIAALEAERKARRAEEYAEARKLLDKYIDKSYAEGYRRGLEEAARICIYASELDSKVSIVRVRYELAERIRAKAEEVAK